LNAPFLFILQMSDSISRNQVTEMQKKLDVLNDGEIFDYICNSRCGNKQKCGRMISSVKSLQECMGLVKGFRNHLWSPPAHISGYNNASDGTSKTLSRRDYRNVQLIDQLFSMRNPITGEINYTLGYDKVPVCKDFFRQCTGFKEKAFNKLLKYVNEYYLENRSERSYDKYFRKEGLAWVLHGKATLHLPEERREIVIEDGAIHVGQPRSEEVVENVLAFLDDFFARGDIDRPADKEKIFVTSLNWKSLYDKYVQRCYKLRLKPTDENRFLAIR
jgi:hypothetical protein